MPTLSVIIPCYNEARYLPRLLERLSQQTRRPDQVIIGDSNSTDNTVAVARSFSDQLPIQVASTSTRTPGAARNAGARLATGDYLVFMDADCLPVGTRFLERLEHALHKSNPDFVTPMFTSDGWHPLDYAFLWGINVGLLIGIAFPKMVPPIGGMMCVRRSDHIKARGFPEGMHSGEDTEYARAILNANARYKQMPWLYVQVSNRRGRQDGRIATMLYCLPKDNALGRRIHKALAKRGKHKEYGTF